MQRVKPANQLTTNEVVEIYNLYLRTLKDELNLNDYPDALKKIFDAQMSLAEMQREDVPLKQLIETMRRHVKLILVDLPADYMLLPFSMNATTEKLNQSLSATTDELNHRLSFYELQGYHYKAIFNAILNVLLYPIDDALFKQFIARFSKVADKHPVFTTSERQDIQSRLRYISELRDLYSKYENSVQSIVMLLDSLPGMEKDEQLKLLKEKLDQLEKFDYQAIEGDCGKMLRGVNLVLTLTPKEKRHYAHLDLAGKLAFIINGRDFCRLSPPDKLCIISARRILNAANGMVMMKKEVEPLFKGIKASESLFQDRLQSMADSQSHFEQSDWDLMERVLLTRDKKQVKTALCMLDLPELKILSKSFNHPKVIEMIDRTPLMKEYREEKFMRKRKVIMGYEPGRPTQRDEEDRSLKSKTEKGKYRDVNHGKNLRKP